MITKGKNNTPVAAIVLAAGMGTRMHSNLHKVLHPIGGLPMISHVLSALDKISVAKRVVVVGAERQQIENAIAGVDFSIQDKQLGTGHAVLSSREYLDEFDGNVLILYGDVPLVSSETMQNLLNSLGDNGSGHTICVLGFRAEDPAQYGRLILAKDNSLEAIVEYKDATSAQRKIDLCNSGIMAVRGKHLFPLLDKISNSNAAGEYYLTDLVALANNDSHTVGVVEVDENEVRGINSKAELAGVENIFQNRMRMQAMNDGVTLLDPTSVYFSHDTSWSSDVTIAQNVVIGTGVTLKEGATVHAFSHLQDCVVGKNAAVGPFVRLRPGADIGESAKIGNFVEVKKSKIGVGVKISHLSYIGDADIGEGANIGAGTITCNYDGFNKFKTIIGEGAFIGSNTALVAPVNIGDGATVGAGSVITGNVEKDALGIERNKQRNIKDWSRKFRDKQGK